MAKRAAPSAKVPPATNRKKKLPATDRADITGAELLHILGTIEPKLTVVLGEDADETARAINAHAYFGLTAHLEQAARTRILGAANTLLQYLDELGYPLVDQLAALHVKLEAAMPHLWFGEPPNGEPYVAAACIVHSLVCSICVRAGLGAGTSRDAVAVRVTAAILQRLDYAVTPGALEMFFAHPRAKAAFKVLDADLQNRK